MQKRQQDVKSVTLDFMSSVSKIIIHNKKNFVLITAFHFVRVYTVRCKSRLCADAQQKRFRAVKHANQEVNMPGGLYIGRLIFYKINVK